MAFWNKEKIDTTSEGITIRAIREDVPEFKREYSAALDDGRSIKITMYTMWRGHRTKSGELTQRDGKWVLFDPDRIADKILDPALVPKVAERVRQIYQLDDNFIHGNAPREFVDEGGDTWRRA